MSAHTEKLKELMMVVIDHYITRGEPIGSKFLHSMDQTDYAPSTLRKYLNLLEQE
jgi:transcriptional regulator of heat shock response